MRTGVILTTYGEPQRNSFAEQWVYSYRILKGLTRKIAKIPKPVLPIISTFRARSRVRGWSENDFLSPLEPLHQKTVKAVEAELRGRGIGADVVVTSAYEFRRPLLGEVLEELGAKGCERAVIVPMYVSAGDFTDGITRLTAEDAIAASERWKTEQLRWCGLSATAETAARMADILYEHCVEEMKRRDVPNPAPDWAVLLAAHGTVINPPPGVDNGLAHYGRVLLRLKTRLKPLFGKVAIGWLNHTRGGKWTTPPVSEALGYVVNAGYSKLVYFPWGFTTDNAETMLEGRVAIEEVKGSLTRVEHLPCVNDRADFVKFVADRICEQLQR